MRLSPSEHHGLLMSRVKPSLGFDGGDMSKWRISLRRKLRQLLGDMPKRRVALEPRTLWKRGHALGTIEKIVFTSEPYADATAYVCLPKNAEPPFRFMICLQGHSSGMHNSIAVQQADETRPLAVEGDRDYAIGCMRRGVAALCLEQRSFGERAEKKQKKACAYNMCHDAFAHSLMLGRTLIGERVYDVDRAIDYLNERGDADMRRIGVMGNSGGGTASVYAAALLPRLALAVPSCSFCTFRDSKMALYHCACGYIPNILKYAEMADVMGLFAPKPVVIVAGRNDPIIPPAGVKRAFRHLKRIYRAAGAEKHCHLVIGNEGHRFYADAAWKAIKREALWE